MLPLRDLSETFLSSSVSVHLSVSVCDFPGVTFVRWLALRFSGTHAVCFFPCGEGGRWSGQG